MTDMSIKRLKPEDKDKFYKDKMGLFVKVAPSGRKTFVYRTQRGGKAVRKTLGVYPAMSLNEARTKLEELKNAPEQKVERPSFASCFDAFLSLHYADNLRELQRYGALYRRLHHLHGVSIDAITPLMLINSFAPLRAQGKHASASKYLGFLKRLFKDALMREYIEHDPCYLLNLKALMGKPPATKHHAFIREPFKIGVLLGDILEYSGSSSVKMAALFGAFTALRPSNARLALWSEIDLEKDIFKIPAFKMKMKAPFDVPIAPPLKRLLLSYKALRLDEDILFPSAYKGAVLSDNAMRSMYRRLGYTKEEFSPKSAAVAPGLKNT